MTTFIFTGKSSHLSTFYNPPIYLEEDAEYEIALINFDSFYSIPNVDSSNNTFKWWSENGIEHLTQIPEGAYEINNLNESMQREMQKLDTNALISINLDHVTSKATIQSNRNISFKVQNSIGSVLGFEEQTIEPDINVSGDSLIDILKINAICIDCNIVGGSFLNGQPVHIIHQFFPTVSPGYKIVEAPTQPIYHPVVVKAITNIIVRIIDQNGNLLNFRDDIRTIRLHLKKV